MIKRSIQFSQLNMRRIVMRADLEGALNILRCLKMKPNYSELSKIYRISRQTISKYDKGFKKKGQRAKGSILDKYADEIKEKINLPGATITGVYKYFYSKDSSIGSRSNFDYYVRKHKLIEKKKIICHPRYETEPGEQLQFDFKEDITMVSKHGEEFKFNILTTTAGFSRMHKFTYSKTRTREDLIRSLIDAFYFYGGIHKVLLTDNMSCIINPATKKISSEFIQFSKDFGFSIRLCKGYSPQTKGKVESANRFMNRLVPYNNEFEDEEDLIRIINKITEEVNNEINQTIKLRPIMLLPQERKYLKALPTKDIIDVYLDYMKPVKVYKDSMIYYKGRRYSVPSKYIGKTLKLKEVGGNLYIYNVKREVINIHPITDKLITYKDADYMDSLKQRFKSIDNEETHKNGI